METKHQLIVSSDRLEDPGIKSARTKKTHALNFNCFRLVKQQCGLITDFVIEFLINKITGRKLYKNGILIRNEQNQTLIYNQVTLERPGIDQLNFSYIIYNKQQELRGGRYRTCIGQSQ